MLLHGFDVKRPLAFDVETISWDDKRGGLHPYKGDRIAGISVAQDDHSIYLPIRHRTDKDGCLPLDFALQEVREWALTVEHLVNPSIKFDLHCAAQDEIFFPKAKLSDLHTLGRLVDNRLMEYSLESMTELWCTKYTKQGEPVKDWLKKNGTNDYGAVPIDIMSTYAKLDTLSAFELYNVLLSLLPDRSKRVWESEQKVTRWVFDMERSGFPIDPNYFAAAEAYLAKEMLAHLENIANKLGYDFNPNSPKQVKEYFAMRGIKCPVIKTKNRKDGTSYESENWDHDSLALVIDEWGVADSIASYKECSNGRSLFAIGWRELADKSNILHGNFKQHGNKTGRFSCSEPNLQNYPKWCLRGMPIPEGYIGLKFDYSQIQYRIFTHYSDDAELIRTYLDNPGIDYHKELAKRMLLEDFRDPIKTANFMVLFGAGRKKTMYKIAKLIYDVRKTYEQATNDPSLLKKLSPKVQEIIKLSGPAEAYNQLMIDLTAKYGDTSSQRNRALAAPQTIASNIYDEYHQKVPACRRLVSTVKEYLAARGYIHNIYGRRYYMDLDLAYKGMNYLCQGGEADIVKERCNAIYEDQQALGLEVHWLTQIHDAIKFIVPIEQAQVTWDRVKALACVCPELKIPLLIDGEVAIGKWENLHKINQPIASILASVPEA